MNTLKPVYERLEKLAATASTNDKIELLKEYLQDGAFRTVVIMALSGSKTYKIKQIPDYKKIVIDSTPKERSLSIVFKILNELTQQAGCTQETKDRLFRAACIDAETFEVIARICKKDLRCGIMAKVVNKARPNTIVSTPYMRCSTAAEMQRIIFTEYPIIQEKADGMFVYMIVFKSGKVKFITRAGMPVFGLGHLAAIIHEKFGNPSAEHEFCVGRVFSGELVCFNPDGSIMPRKEGNGILNKCIQGTVSKEEAKTVRFQGWDSLSLEDFSARSSEVPYVVRLKVFQDMVRIIDNPKISVITTSRVNSVQDAFLFYQKMRALGKEGAIIKNVYGLWKDHTSTDQIKLKNVSDAELRIIGWEYGTPGTAFEKCMGNIICESEDQQLLVNVGTGFSEEDRQLDWDQIVADKTIVEILYESVITSKKADKKPSLFLPRFNKLRLDKEEADTLPFLLERDKVKNKTGEETLREDFYAGKTVN